MRILLVEDEEKVARFVARGLKAERHAVDIAADGIRKLRTKLSDHQDYVETAYGFGYRVTEKHI